MNSILNQNLYFIKEHVGVFKAANNFDIFNPDSQQIIMNCREENLSFITKFFRFTDYKRMTPFDILVKTIEGKTVLTVKRGFSLFLSTVEVFDENENLVGRFKQRFFSIGGKFDIYDANESILCSLIGKWTSWDFKFVKDNVEFAHVSKKWAGIGKELFTSADNYMLNIDKDVPSNHPIRILILAAVLCIDMVIKE
jgi:uncharacterized protein YxjI